MRFLNLMWIPLLVWLCSPASARTYQYTDKDGVVHFTDSLSKVPPDQLPDAEPGGGKEGVPAPEGTQKASDQKDVVPAKENGAAKEKETGKGAKENDNVPIIDKMNKEKAALDAEHDKLVKKREALEDKRSTLKTPEEVRAYQKKVKELNKEVEAYDKRNRAFRKDVDAYNKALKEEEEK
jgi:hypothetical protein